jgi:hypothetical protein
MASACPGAIDQKYMGVLGQPVIRTEVSRIDVARVLDAGSRRKADFDARINTADDLMQRMLA